jgi:hypothetical protein
MKKISINPVARALVVFGAVVAMVGGVTYAAYLNNQVTLADSRMSSTTASLKIRTQDSRRWSDEVEGFRIRNLVPGTGETRHIYFKNAGGVPLKLSVDMPRWQRHEIKYYGFDSLDSVIVRVTGDNCGRTITTNMTQLLRRGSVDLPCRPLAPKAEGNPASSSHVGNYTIYFDIDPNAITGSKAGVGRFDLEFTGEQG